MAEKLNLADFLKDIPVVPKSGTDADRILTVPMDDILDDPKNFYSLDGLEELAANIETVGLQQPILVRPADEARKYIIVSGHRRRAACQKVLGWTEMRCMVTTVTGSPELMELSLIYANADTRKLSAADISKQAERVTELLYKLKEQGYEFPGRMRDHVAEAVGISKSKLGRLEVIRKNLASDFKPMWNSGQLNENVAYTLAQLDPGTQNLIYNGQTATGTKPFRCTAGHVERLVRNIEQAKRSCQNAIHIDCSHCNHDGVRISMASRLGDLCGLDCTGCCCSCYALHRCKNSCPKAAEEKRQKKEVEAAAKRRAADEAAAKAKPKIDLMTGIFHRIGEARAETNVDGGELYKIVKGWGCVGDAEELAELEAGAGITENTYAFGISPNDLQKIIRLADTLNCSVDWLLGLAGKQAAPTWQTGQPKEPGKYVVIRRYRKCKPEACDCVWNGAEWKDYDGSDLSDGVAVLMWQPWPEVEE